MFVPMTDGAEYQSGTEGKWFIVDGRGSVLLDDGDIPRAVDAPMVAEDVHFLGVQASDPVWAARAATGATPPPMSQWVNLRQLYGSIPEEDWALAGRAAQIINWDRDHRYCGRCGAETRLHDSDRARVCQACELMSYPRLTPAVIVLVEREDGKALLAWGRQFPGRFYSALAGFVEPGESLEECVEREVKEEVGIDIGDISYFGSQPWPFPHSVMIGFNARYEAGDIVPQESEIVEAGWYDHEELPPVPRGGMSIAGWLIEDWVKRQRR